MNRPSARIMIDQKQEFVEYFSCLGSVITRARLKSRIAMAKAAEGSFHQQIATLGV